MLHYTEPDERVVLIDGDRMTIVVAVAQRPADAGHRRRPGRVQKYFVDGSPHELRRHFEIAAATAASRRGYLVTMVPKRKQIQEGLTRLELWIDATVAAADAMR